MASAAAPAAPAPSAATASAPAASAASAPSSAPPSAPEGEEQGHIDETNVYARDRAAAALEVPLTDVSGHPLPQTNERPSTKTASFEARMSLIERAIKFGHAEDALPAFFPVGAYAQVKDIPEPEKDWEHRLVGAFRRDLAEYRKKLGPGAEKSILVNVSVPEAQARFMKPGSEGNRVGYYRVLRSRLTFRLASGKERSFEVTSMISWRGEWYVVHLHGFR